MDMPIQEAMPSPYKVGPFELKSDRIDLVIDGKEERFLLKDAHNLGQWIVEHPLDLGGMKEEDFLLMFLMKRLEMMGEAGAADLNRLRQEVSKVKDKETMTTLEHDWEEAKFNFEEIHIQAGLEMPEKLVAAA